MTESLINNHNLSNLSVQAVMNWVKKEPQKEKHLKYEPMKLI